MCGVFQIATWTLDAFYIFLSIVRDIMFLVFSRIQNIGFLRLYSLVLNVVISAELSESNSKQGVALICSFDTIYYTY